MLLHFTVCINPTSHVIFRPHESDIVTLLDIQSGRKGSVTFPLAVTPIQLHQWLSQSWLRLHWVVHT